jgi:hypothetical protein
MNNPHIRYKGKVYTAIEEKVSGKCSECAFSEDIKGCVWVTTNAGFHCDELDIIFVKNFLCEMLEDCLDEEKS